MARPPLPTSALPGIPEMATSDIAAAVLAWPAAAGLLADAVAGEAAGLEVALEAVLLELLEHAAASSPIAAAPAAPAIRFFMIMLPL